MGGLEDPLNLAGTLFLPRFHWVWMLVSLGLGAWVGWRTAGEPNPVPRAAPAEEDAP